MKRNAGVITVLLMMCSPLRAELKDIGVDLGVYGTVFPILERNIIEVIQEKLASPKGQQLLRDFETRLKKASEEKHYVPAAVATITPTLEHRSYLFNPSVSLSEDLFDHNHVRFYKAGDSVNPLDSITLSKEYLFIDGDNPLHVEWAKRTQSHKKVALILVKGDPMRLMEKKDIKVFFDQEGAMSSRFQLSHVPCSLAQEGKMLRITEWTEDELSEQTVAKHSSAGLTETAGELGVESGVEPEVKFKTEPVAKAVAEFEIGKLISPLDKDLKREGKTP